MSFSWGKLLGKWTSHKSMWLLALVVCVLLGGVLLSCLMLDAMPVNRRCPMNLKECFEILDKQLSEEEKLEIKNHEKAGLSVDFLGLGLWIRNSWGLWSESKLARYFNRMGIEHPDDMSDVVLESYRRHLNGKPLDIGAQVADVKEYWATYSVPDNLRCPVCSMELKCDFGMASLDSEHPMDYVFVCLCAQGHAWFYSKDHGLYVPRSMKDREVLSPSFLSRKSVKQTELLFKDEDLIKRLRMYDAKHGRGLSWNHENCEALARTNACPHD